MRTFKQHLNALEKQRKLEKSTLSKDNVITGKHAAKSSTDNSFPNYVHGKHAAKSSTDNSFPNYVHGKHAAKSSTDNSFPNYVHGKHASNKINEEADTGSEPNYLKDWIYEHNKNVNGGQGIDSLHEELTNHYHEDLSGHPKSNDVVDYTKGSSELNGALIRSHESGASDIEPVSDEYNYMSELRANLLNERRNGIDKAITSIPAPKDFDTYSGIGFDPRRRMDQNGILYTPAYISSSINPGIAESFSHVLDRETGESPMAPNLKTERHILRIPVKQYQTNGVYVDSISNFGTKEGQIGEKEFLHPRGQKYKIDPTPKTFIRSKHDDTLTHIWTATPIED